MGFDDRSAGLAAGAVRPAGPERGGEPNDRVHSGRLSVHHHSWVGVAGFEPTASSSRTRRATKLRHTPVFEQVRA